jgi:hypothetical protein
MTKPTYEIITDFFGSSILKRTDPDGKEWFIPMDESNSDYQDYLNPKEDEADVDVEESLETETELAVDEADTE